MTVRILSIVALCAALYAPCARAADQTFEAGSLIIPMDLAYQDHGMFQAYGLLFQLLRQGVPVTWAIDADKQWHASPCDTAGEECAWDCLDEGSGLKCPYPTASPDFFATASVVWDGETGAAAGTPVPRHGYRGGPFVIAAADAEAALPIIAAWNDPAQWADHSWAQRTEFQVVTVHEAGESFTANVRKQMLAAPTIAVFSDGNENIATGYLRAAGIPQSNGNEFPDAKCGADDCGPGTANPDMLTVPSVAGDMGTCDAPNQDHENGALFTADGLPAYCQIMSMHWGVNDRETVECEGGCGASQEDCTGRAITYHGHEVVAEVRAFLQYPVHFFAECQAVNAYENTVPNPDWPWLDDEGRDGHFLTTTGSPPACPDGDCDDGDFECVPGGCDAGAVDCCLPRNIKELGAGFLIAAQPDADDIQILHPGVPYNQLDGAFDTVGGSEPAYNLSAYLQTAYKNDREVTFVTGPEGPGDQDVWMTGYIDGECEIDHDDAAPPQPGECTGGKVSYLGGHRYMTDVPLSTNPDSQGARLFLNALFEADCVTSIGQPTLNLVLDGPRRIGLADQPVEAEFSLRYSNLGRGAALGVDGSLTLPDGVGLVEAQPEGALDAGVVRWALGSISADPALAGDPPSSGSRWARLSFSAPGTYTLTADLDYLVGASDRRVGPVALVVEVLPDADGDGVADEDDPYPDDPMACGDSDGDTCDDCSQTGQFDPANDGPDADGDGICDDGDSDGGDGGPDDPGKKSSGCSCAAAAGPGGLLAAGLLIGLALWRRRWWTDLT